MRARLTTLYPFFSLLVGLTLTQIIASVQVYLSNTVLHDSLLSIKNAGYLSIPNPHVMAGLLDIGPAIFGAFFFTFSIGAGISFLTLATAWIRQRVFNRNKYFFYACLLLWSGCLVVINIQGFKFILTLTGLFVPPAVFAMASGSIAYISKHKRRPYDRFHILPVIILALLLGWQIDNRMFTDFRDVYLLSNPVGARINSFYYKYTLYPAEVLKSLDQKMLKTGRIESGVNMTSRKALENILLSHDYIPIGPNADVDLKILTAGKNVIMENRGKPVLQVSSDAFSTDPHRAIRDFEEKSDTDRLLRKITFLSLLFGFPLAVYVIMHGLVSILIAFLINIRTASLAASGLCFTICIILMFVFQLNRGRDVAAQNIAQALSSSHWQTRVGALKLIDEKGLEISEYKSYPALQNSTHIAERYWLVRTLGNSKRTATYDDLIRFLDDPHPNIVSMALYAIGKRGNQNAIDDILKLIDASDNWYIQWYAYKALRSIGWRQTKSKQEP